MKKKYNKELDFTKSLDKMFQTKRTKNEVVKARRRKDRRGRNCRSLQEGGAQL